MNPAIPNWKEVPEKKKDELWDKQLKLNFRFSEGKQELVKMLSRSWESHSDVGRWSSTRSISKKGLTPFNEFGNITPSQWEELVAQKTSPEAIELSARNTELTKRNKHHHHLGPGGYYAKEEQF